MADLFPEDCNYADISLLFIRLNYYKLYVELLWPLGELQTFFLGSGPAGQNPPQPHEQWPGSVQNQEVLFLFMFCPKPRNHFHKNQRTLEANLVM